MIYGFIRQSNGRMEIESEPGRGTLFQIYLPIGDAVAEVTAARVPATNDTPEGRGETVLVVEDDPDLRLMTVTLLEYLGYRTRIAEDGDTAVAAFENNPEIRIVLSDVVLPGPMSGVEAVEQMRRLRPNFAALFVSGYPGEHLEAYFDGEQDAPILTKPFTRQTLGQKLREVLDAQD